MNLQIINHELKKLLKSLITQVNLFRFIVNVLEQKYFYPKIDYERLSKDSIPKSKHNKNKSKVIVEETEVNVG